MQDAGGIAVLGSGWFFVCLFVLCFLFDLGVPTHSGREQGTRSRETKEVMKEEKEEQRVHLNQHFISASKFNSGGNF